MSQSKEHLIWCGPDDTPRELHPKFDRVLPLSTVRGPGNVYLQVENISRKLARDLPAIARDMLEVGSYVYSADQAISRGGRARRGDGQDWFRNLHLDIQVRRPELWNRSEVKDALSDALRKLSGDNWEFSFRKLTKDIPVDGYFPFDKGEPWFLADEVLLFSGGLDSLAGAIDEISNRQKKVVLVSHRPVAKISKRQVELVERLTRCENASGKVLHVPVWMNKEKGLTKDDNQRSRTFLYTMLAATVCLMHDIRKIKFYENGIVSINLPIAQQLVGARASRSTHPMVLTGLSRFLSVLLDEEYRVENPFIWKTKSDVVALIKESGNAELLRYAHSCSHVRTTDRKNTHCGVCSQCVERRMAILYNGMEGDDPPESYQVKHFLDPIEKPRDRVMVMSYIEHAKTLKGLQPDAFFGKYGEVYRVFGNVDLPDREAAERVYDLHLRHARQVCEVIDSQIRANASTIRQGKVEPDSLLAMVVKQPRGKKRKGGFDHTFPTPEGATWKDVRIDLVSNDSVRISVLDKTERFAALDMGFRDKRKKDMLTQQWDLLIKFAESSGVLSWANPVEKTALYKDMQALRNILKSFLGIQDSPIKSYQKGIGYVAEFEIQDLRFGMS